MAGGPALRGAVFDGGLAVSFMVVAAVTLGPLLMGWRATMRIVPLRRAPRGA